MKLKNEFSLEEQKAVDEFLEDARTQMIPGMRRSGFVMAILDGQIDIKIALEVGCAIMLEKPLIVLAVKGAWVPRKLVEIADRIVRIDDINSPDAREKVMTALSEIHNKLIQKQ